VTVQAQILRLLQKLQQELGLALLLITHDLGIVARIGQRVSVMYAGEVVETGLVAQVFAAPTHPYTRGLLDCIPVPGKAMPECAGNVPLREAGDDHSYLCRLPRDWKRADAA
jgi:peptide/nickel transport system ATP-binding protein